MFEPNLGIYSCDGKKFHSKITACLHSELTGQPVQWWFHNETYDNFPWHLEPPETLDQLYDFRARELREQYDYLMLSYSGGSDSHNMVQSFVRQGLHIDEILTNHMTKATENFIVKDRSVTKNWNFNAEHELNAIPRLNELRQQLPNTKFTIVDVSDMVLNSLQTFDDVHWVLSRTEQLSVGQAFRYNFYHFADVKKQFDKGKKVAIVVGVDKPKSLIDENGWYKIFFSDVFVNISSVNEFNADYPNVRTELFYWSNSTAGLIAKQAHTIYRWLRQNPRRAAVWRSNTFNLRNLQEPTLRQLLYNNWHSNWFQTQKSTNALYTEYDQWFHSSPDFKRQQILWHKGIEYLSNVIPNYVKKNQDGDRKSVV